MARNGQFFYVANYQTDSSVIKFWGIFSIRRTNSYNSVFICYKNR